MTDRWSTLTEMIYLTVVRLTESSVSEVAGEQGRETLDRPELSLSSVLSSSSSVASLG